MAVTAGAGVLTVTDTQALTWTLPVNEIEAIRAQAGQTVIVLSSGQLVFLSDTVAAVNTALAASILPVTVTNFPATQPVTNANDQGTYTRITASGATVVKSGSGTLQRVVCGGNGASTTATLYDNTAASGTIMLVTLTPKTPFVLDIRAKFNTGLTVGLSGASDLTVIWT